MYIVVVRDILYFCGYKYEGGRMKPQWEVKGNDFQLAIFSKREDAELEALNYQGAVVQELMFRMPIKRADTK